MTTWLRALGDVAVLGTFAVVTLLPLLLGAEQSPDAVAEGRPLAPWPERPRDREGWEAWPAKYEKWFDDHFGGRRRLLQLHTRVLMGVFGVSPTEQVVVGTDGWLYFTKDGIFPDRRGEEALQLPELERWRTVLEARKAWFDARGIRYTFAVAPNKVTVYPQHLPWHHRARPDVPTRLQQIVDHLRTSSTFRVVDTRDALVAAARTRQVYHATDSHWNDLGAYVFYRAVVDDWRRQGLAIEPLPETTFDARSAPRRGDLVPLIAGASVPDEIAWSMVPRQPLPAKEVPLPPGWDAPPPEWGVWTQTFVYECATGDGVLLVVGDSFAHQLKQFLTQHFRRTVFVSVGWHDFAVVRAMCEVVQPTVVLEQRVERNVKYLPQPHPQATGR